MNHYQHDILVIGSGLAGLSLALRLADNHKIAVIAKEALREGSTYYAQGGVSVVLDKTDSIESHVLDTVNTGVGLCDEKIVQFTVERGRKNIQWLIDIGVLFSKDSRSVTPDNYHLTKEGGHSHRRVIHAADATGKAIETTLEQLARDHPNIELFEHHIAIDLITQQQQCIGAYILNKAKGNVVTFSAGTVVLATGGAGKVYLYTSNPDVATGDGIAMGWRAGCRVANMEFIQFHPTCLYHPKAKSFLITEAIRGEGGKLLLPDGTPFMDKFDPRAELAPRDIVARSIDFEMKRLGAECVFLDISHQPKSFIANHFPTVYSRCKEYGIDIAKEPIPVVPAAHYSCGGIMTNQHGQTDLAGLYAIGETAYTGLHGANRMASNSLLECLVFGSSAAEHIATQPKQPIPAKPPSWDESRVTPSNEEVVVTHSWDELRRFMWDYVGIVRTNKRLTRAMHRVDLLSKEIDDYYAHFRVTGDLIELRNLALIAKLIIQSALSRKESRGLHYTLDYPELDSTAVNTLLSSRVNP